MGAKIDLTGRRFDRLTVIRATDKRESSGSVLWECKCDCGKVVLVAANSLRSGRSRSCGCLKNEALAQRVAKDLTCKQFGRLKAIRPTDERRAGSIVWECKCLCGNTVLVRAKSLVSGKTKSCGCLNRDVSKSRALEKASVDSVAGTRLSYLNKTVFINNSSGYRGVYFRKRSGKWEASIGFRGAVYHLGLYSNIEDAAKARKIAEEELWKPFLEQYLGRYEDEVERKKRLNEYFRNKILEKLTPSVESI